MKLRGLFIALMLSAGAALAQSADEPLPPPEQSADEAPPPAEQTADEPAPVPAVPATVAKDSGPENYRKAIDLIHAAGGSEGEREGVMKIAHELQQSQPDKGYYQALQAEATATWEVGQDGSPDNMVALAIQLADEAIDMNRGLVLPHVAKARALVRASRYDEANAAIAAAKALDPDNDNVAFLSAEVLRRTDNMAEAEKQYLEFIRLTDTDVRRSNGYYWLGTGFVAAARLHPDQRDDDLANARAAFEQDVRLDPRSAGKTVNFAIFLNDDGADYAAAEKYAKQALAIADIPEARNQLAIARYQQLLAELDATNDVVLKAKVDEIGKDTQVSLDDAIVVPDISGQVAQRLAMIRDRLAKAGTPAPDA